MVEDYNRETGKYDRTNEIQETKFGLERGAGIVQYRSPVMKVETEYGTTRFYDESEYKNYGSSQSSFEPPQTAKLREAQQIFRKLGFTGSFSDLKAVKVFYRQQSRKVHPDINLAKGIDTTAQFKELGGAYIELEKDKGQTSERGGSKVFIPTHQRIVIEFPMGLMMESITSRPLTPGAFPQPRFPHS